MLREFRDVRQEPGPGKRRWWGGDGIEFTVWYDADGAVTGYQLSFRGCAFTWQTDNGYWTHVTVNERIASPKPERHRVNMRALGLEHGGGAFGMNFLQPNGGPSRPPFELLSLFENASLKSVDGPERELVAETLRTVVRQKAN